MTRAVLLAALAGALAAAAIVELAALAGQRARRRAAAGDDRQVVSALPRLLAALGLRLGVPLSAPAGLSERVAAAGLPAAVGAGEVMAVKAGGALAAALAGLVLAAGAPGRLGPVVAVAVPIAAWLAPDHWLRRRARDRGRVMAEELPEVLDLLRVVVAAGMPVGRALGEVGRRRGGLLAGELVRSADRIALGVPRAERWPRQLRCPLPAAATVRIAVERADRHGAPLAPALAALAADARAQRARRLGDRAARAAPKIQLVIALLLVPAVLLLVAAGLLGALR